MPIEIECTNGVCILYLKGRLASGMDPEYLYSKADEVKTQSYSRKIMVDLRELDSIGSTGIGFLMSIYTTIIKDPAGRFVMVGANSRVYEVLDLTRLSTILPLATDIASALAALSDDDPPKQLAAKIPES